MKDPVLEQLVLQYVFRPNYQPVKPRVIAKKLELSEEERERLGVTIKRLAKRGLIVYGANHLVAPVVEVAAKVARQFANPSPPPPAEAKSNPDESPTVSSERKSTRGNASPFQEPTRKRNRSVVSGVFRRTSKGFGFVHPSNSTATDRSEDIFIPENCCRDAANGDVVTVRISRQKRGPGRVGGEIVEVLERNTHRFVGIYFERDGGAFVNIDGKVFEQPISVGDPGVKNANEGDKVVIEMVRFPTHLAAGEAVIIEVLGARGAPGVDTLSIIREYHLPEEFPEDVQAAAREQAEKFDEENFANRRDFTADTVITIDPIDARDFDDAISLTRLENGHWRLGVHIADVSHFVPPKSALDREARDRATSVYLPDRVIPMLPEIISNNLASLQPHRVRYTQTAIIEFTPDGKPVAAEVHHGAIRSKRRFTYEEVDEWLADPAPWREKLPPDVFTLLEQMHELAMILRRRRIDGGSIELTLPEVKIQLDRRGEVCGAKKVENTVSHQIIEEFMLAANEAVARVLSDKGLEFLRRVHESPDPRKLEALTVFVRDMGIKCDSLESRFEIKRVIAAVAGKPEETAVNYAVLRSMQKAIYSPSDEGHYALHSRHYCHFTSPIRRYPDLTVHRIFTALAHGRKPAETLEMLLALGEHCSEREQRAAQAERELTKVKLLGYMQSRIGEQMDAVVTGVESFGLFAQGIQIPAEGMVHITALSDDTYRYDRKSHSLTGYRAGHSFRLGDLIRVEIANVDVDRRELDFRVIKRLPHPNAPATTRKSPSRTSKPKPPFGKQTKSKKRKRR